MLDLHRNATTKNIVVFFEFKLIKTAPVFLQELKNETDYYTLFLQTLVD